MRIKKLIDGVLVLDKPLGITSNRALQQVKHLFQAAKAGHTGSLDPLATGVLPICFGKSTKIAQSLLDADKTYVVTAKLGVVTDTSDAEGQIISEHAVPEFSQQQILQAIAKFTGSIQQVPSMFSALKHKGQPLYKLARKGLVIERPPRNITVYQFLLLEQTHDTLTCEIKCSKGTYIRTLIDDLGKELGCGAHVSALRRTQAGPYSIDQAVPLEQLLALKEQQNLVQYLAL